jgi:predicted transcriptional regulator
MATTIKVSEATRDRVKAIGAQTRQPADAVISQALDELERKLFWQDYAAQRASERGPLPQSALAERAAWDATADDGLEPEIWDEDPFA